MIEHPKADIKHFLGMKFTEVHLSLPAEPKEEKAGGKKKAVAGGSPTGASETGHDQVLFGSCTHRSSNTSTKALFYAYPASHFHRVMVGFPRPLTEVGHLYVNRFCC